MDGPMLTPVASLFQGVSRQPGPVRAPNQFDELENVFPSVDLSGPTRRPGAEMVIAGLARANYATGSHHIFRTTDGTPWLLLRRAVGGLVEVRNLLTGAPAVVNADPQAENYLNAGARSLRFLQVADTTLIVNTGVTVEATVPAVPPLSAVYLWVRRTSTAKQEFIVTGAGRFAQVALLKDNEYTREEVTQQLLSALMINFSGAGLVFALAGANASMVKITGPANVLADLEFRNSWDPSSALIIKGRVPSTSDLPSVIDNGAVLMVDLKQGDPSAAFYVRYNASTSSWLECSYDQTGATTATFAAHTMPVRLRQTGANAFSLEVCPWTSRKVGDDTTNPLPFFRNRRISDIASWKGRLVLACEDTISFSQADDYFNFFKETARESRPADALDLPADTDALAVIRHVVPFRNTLFVAGDRVQLEVPGDRPLTPETASISPTTSYTMSPGCRPSVVGDALYFAGLTDGRGAVWQYFYDDTQSSNTAFDLSKHVPGYVEGTVQKIVGSPTAGRLFLLASRTRNVVYTHTQYWSGQERVQNAWTKGVVLDQSLTIEDIAVLDDSLFILAGVGLDFIVLRIPVDAQNVARQPLQLPYLDQLTRAYPVFNAGANRTEVPVPASMSGQTVVLAGYALGEDWWREYTGTVVNGQLRIDGNATGLHEYWLGVRFRTRIRFSPFYMRDEQGKAMQTGTLQVRRVNLALQVTGDFTASVARPDRATPTVVQRSARLVGGQFVRPVLGRDIVVGVPFNAKGDGASLTLDLDASTPWNLTGYTLMGRYSNPYA